MAKKKAPQKPEKAVIDLHALASSLDKENYRNEGPIGNRSLIIPPGEVPRVDNEVVLVPPKDIPGKSDRDNVFEISPPSSEETRVEESPISLSPPRVEDGKTDDSPFKLSTPKDEPAANPEKPPIDLVAPKSVEVSEELPPAPITPPRSGEAIPEPTVKPIAPPRDEPTSQTVSEPSVKLDVPSADERQAEAEPVSLAPPRPEGRGETDVPVQLSAPKAEPSKPEEQPAELAAPRSEPPKPDDPPVDLSAPRSDAPRVDERPAELSAPRSEPSKTEDRPIDVSAPRAEPPKPEEPTAPLNIPTDAKAPRDDLPAPLSPPAAEKRLTTDIPVNLSPPVDGKPVRYDPPVPLEPPPPEAPKKEADSTTALSAMAGRIDADKPEKAPDISASAMIARNNATPNELWEKIITFGQASLNSGIDSADIPDNHLRTASDLIFDNGVCEKAKGKSNRNAAALGSGAVVDGIWRAQNKTGDKQLLVICGGIMYYFLDGDNTAYNVTWEIVGGNVTGLAASASYSGLQYSFLNHNDRVLIANGYDAVMEYDPKTKTLRKLGLEPPRFFRKASYFESDETVTQVTATAAKDTSIFSIAERSGDNKNSLKLTASGAGVTPEGYVVPKNERGTANQTDFSTFPNGQSITDNDFLCLSVFHRTRSYISNIQVDAYTSSGNYYRVTIDIAELDPIYHRDSQWTDLKIRRSRFAATGSPAWNNITRFYYRFTSVAGGTSINIDNVYFKNAPIWAAKYKAVIDSFEGPIGDWSVAGGTLTDNTDIRYVNEETKSSKWVFSSDTSFGKNLGTALDLTKYVDGITSQTSDEICIWVFCPDTSNLTNITIYLLNNTNSPPTNLTGANGYSKQFTAASDFNKTTTGAWTQLRAKKSAFSNVGTPTGWNSINRLVIAGVRSGSVTLYFDNWDMEEYQANKDICTIENSETWVGSPTTCITLTTDEDFVSRGDYALAMKVPKAQSYYATRDIYTALSGYLDLTNYGASEASGTDDVISICVGWTVFTSIKEIEVQLDCKNSAAAPDYSEYFSYKITPAQLQAALALTTAKASALKNKKVYIDIKKSDFAMVGTTAGSGWSKIRGCKLIVYTAMKGTATTVYFDDLHLKRATGLYGLYQFGVLFFTADGIKSALGEWSNQISLAGTKAYLKNLPVSQDSNVIGRMIYRCGGSLGSYARLDTTVWDNSTTVIKISLDDILTGTPLASPDIPTGTIRAPSIGKWCSRKFMERGIGLRDTTNLRRLWFTNAGYLHTFSDLQFIDFETDILDAFVKDNVLFINTVEGIKFIADDLGSFSPSSLQNTGLHKPSVAAFGSVQLNDAWSFVSFDGAYLFNGRSYKLISDPVKNYFDMNNYDNTKARAAFRDNHLYISVVTTGGTRTLLDCYLPTMAWRSTAYVANCLCLFDAEGDKHEAYAGDVSGYVYQFEHPTVYADSFVLETKDFTAEDPFREIIVHGVDIIAKSKDASAGYLSLKFRVDQVQNDTNVPTFPRDASNLPNTYTLLKNIITGGTFDVIKGNMIGVRIYPSATAKHAAIKAIKLWGIVAPLEKTFEV